MRLGRRLILSTCGTSVLTNGADAETRRWLSRYGNEGRLDAELAERLKRLAEDRRAALDGADEAARRRLSAEYNGLVPLLEDGLEVQHVLLHTDTAVGRAAAEVVQSCFESTGPVTPLTAGGLRTADPMEFRTAVSELMKSLEQFGAYRDSGYEVVYNLTGGFKSVNAYLQAAGAFFADRCVFLFEGASQLMEIPRLPVALDETETVRRHLELFRRWEVSLPVSVEQAAGVPETLVETDGQEAIRSVWGDVVWARAKLAVLGEELLPPLSPRVQFGPKVKELVAGLERQQIEKVNQTFDDLAAHLETGRPLPARSTLKPLQGKPRPPSTHEIYLWSDGAAWRAFGRLEDGQFLVDTIGEHL